MNIARPSHRTDGTPLSKPSQRRPQPRSGLTMVEVSISTLMVGLLMVASLQAVANVGRTWTTTNRLTDGQGLAQDLLWEILAQHYVDPTDWDEDDFGTNSGENTRATFDDIDDYKNWSESPVKNAAGTPLTGYTGWSRYVEIRKIDPNDYSVRNDNSSDKGLRRVTVFVSSPTGGWTIVRVYRSDVPGTLQPLSANLTLVTWVGCTMKLGTNAPATAGISVSNHAEDQ